MENGGGLTELPAKMDAFLNATSRCPFCAENFESIGDAGARRNLLELHALVHHPLAYTTLAHHIDRLDLAPDDFAPDGRTPSQPLATNDQPLLTTVQPPPQPDGFKKPVQQAPPKPPRKDSDKVPTKPPEGSAARSSPKEPKESSSRAPNSHSSSRSGRDEGRSRDHSSSSRRRSRSPKRRSRSPRRDRDSTEERSRHRDRGSQERDRGSSSRDKEGRDKAAERDEPPPKSYKNLMEMRASLVKPKVAAPASQAPPADASDPKPVPVKPNTLAAKMGR